MEGKCVKQTVIAVIVTTDGGYFVGSNWCKHPREKCPREGRKSGEGYDLCKIICEQRNHAEVDACLKAGKKAKGATLILIGHSYCCDNCKKVMTAYGISEVLFAREN